MAFRNAAGIFDAVDFVIPCKTMIEDYEQSLVTSENIRVYWDATFKEAIKRNTFNETLNIKFVQYLGSDPTNWGKSTFYCSPSIIKHISQQIMKK